jgi:hypothetical protein
MAYLLFIDECGQDHKETPYEVLAGVAIHDSALWQLIQEIKSREKYYFGNFYIQENQELKALKILKKKTFRLANQLSTIESDLIPSLTQSCLIKKDNCSKPELTAFAQAKLKFVEEMLDICKKYNTKVFASIINYRNPDPRLPLDDWVQNDYLRQDYAYLFERFFYFLEDQNDKNAIDDMGIVIFDELEKSKSHILHDQMNEYFQKTNKGKERSSYIIPEPFFVHSDLTTGVFVADIIAYCLAFGFRLEYMKEPKRPELDKYVSLICDMRYRASRLIPSINRNEPAEIWSIAIIN